VVHALSDLLSVRLRGLRSNQSSKAGCLTPVSSHVVSVFWMADALIEPETNNLEPSGQAQAILGDRVNVRSNPRVFDFHNLPTELAIEILMLVVASSSYRATYRSLIRVSRSIKTLVYQVCFPHLPIMLRTPTHYFSFASLLAAHPTTVKPSVRFVWFADVEGTVPVYGMYIFHQCPQLTHVACSVNLLEEFLSSPRPFAHVHLTNLTLVGKYISWRRLRRWPTSQPFFAQITHLRVNIPYPTCSPHGNFASLTCFSYTHPKLHFDKQLCPCLDSAGFPALHQIVPTIPYMNWQGTDPKLLKTAGMVADPKFEVLTCPEHWRKEADIWEEGRRGASDIWALARSAEYLQECCAEGTRRRSGGGPWPPFHDSQNFEIEPNDRSEDGWSTTANVVRWRRHVFG
jgi:hypothetical protein